MSSTKNLRPPNEVRGFLNSVLDVTLILPLLLLACVKRLAFL